MLFRDKKGRLLAGLEITNQISQLSYCYSDHLEPETYSLLPGQEKFSIPTLLCKRFEANQWYFGEDAQAKKEEGTLIDRLLSAAHEEGTTMIEGEEFPSISLLALFVKRCLSLVSFVCGGEGSDYLMITMDHVDEKSIEVMEGIRDYLCMDKEHFFFQGRAESFYQYVMHQSKDLRGHNVLLLDSREGFSSLRMEMNVRTSPVVSFIEEKQHESGVFETLPEEEELREVVAQRKDEKLLNALKERCEERIVTAIFLVGDGFAGGWMQESLRYMCSNKRVFQGNNLCSKGACYGVIEKVYPSDVSEKYLFLGKDKVKSNIGLLALSGGEEQYIPLLNAGKNWFEVEETREYFLEEGAAIKFIITPLNGREKRQLQMVLEDFPERPRGASRIRISLSFEDEEHMKVRVQDLGFGVFFAATDYEVEEQIEV